jgi:hypothetical protein
MTVGTYVTPLTGVASPAASAALSTAGLEKQDLREVLHSS